jgi:hypothetical protein
MEAFCDIYTVHTTNDIDPSLYNATPGLDTPIAMLFTACV